MRIHPHAVAMKPAICQGFAADGRGDGDLVLMVGEDQFAAAGVDVNRLPQIFGGHGHTLDMPGRPHVAPLGFRKQAPLEFRKPGPLEEGEIPWVVLFILVQIDGMPQPYLLQIDARKAAVSLQARNIEVEGTQFLVGEALLHQRAGQLHHVFHMLAGQGIEIRRLNAQKRHVPFEIFDVAPGKCFQALAGFFGSLDGFVVQVGDVDQMPHGIPPVGQIAAEQICKNIAPALAQVQGGIGCGTTGIDADLARLQCFQGLFAALHRIEQMDIGFLRGREQGRAEIALTAVGQNDHEGSGFQGAGLAQGHRHGRTAAHAHEKALFPGQAPGGFKGLFIVDVDLLVDAAFVEDFRAVGFLEVLQPLQLMTHVRLDGDDPNLGVEALQSHGKPHDGAAGAEGGHHMGHLAFGLLPDFDGRALLVGHVVGRVVELVRHEILVRVFTHQAVDFLDGAVRAEMPGRQQDIGPPGPEDLLALDAGGFRHGQQQAIALDRAHQRQPDARVAAGGLDHGFLRGQLPAAFARFDHEEGGPILDRSPGVHVLQFGEHAHRRIGVEVADLHQGRMADFIDEGMGHDLPFRPSASAGVPPYRGQRRARAAVICPATSSGGRAASRTTKRACSALARAR